MACHFQPFLLPSVSCLAPGGPQSVLRPAIAWANRAASSLSVNIVCLRRRAFDVWHMIMSPHEKNKNMSSGLCFSYKALIGSLKAL